MTLQVHQMCLQRWVDEKQKGNLVGKVSCPQCNTEYIIVYPKMGKLMCFWVSCFKPFLIMSMSKVQVSLKAFNSYKYYYCIVFVILQQ